jgi:hypothetical protein
MIVVIIDAAVAELEAIGDWIAEATRREPLSVLSPHGDLECRACRPCGTAMLIAGPTAG